MTIRPSDLKIGTVYRLIRHGKAMNFPYRYEGLQGFMKFRQVKGNSYGAAIYFDPNSPGLVIESLEHIYEDREDQTQNVQRLDQEVQESEEKSELRTSR